MRKRVSGYNASFNIPVRDAKHTKCNFGYFMKLSVRLKVFLSMCFLLLSGYIFMGRTNAAHRSYSAVPALQKPVNLPKISLPANQTLSVRTLPYANEKETQQLDETDSEDDDDDDDESFSLKKYTAPAYSLLTASLFKHSVRHSRIGRKDLSYARHFSFYTSQRVIAFRSIRI